MFSFALVILVYFGYLGYEYIPSTYKYIKEYIKYGCYNKGLSFYKEYMSRYKLSDSGLKNIKNKLFEHNNLFDLSDSILLYDKSTTNASFIMKILPTYHNVSEWGTTQLGDVIFLLNLTPVKTTRSYIRAHRCYDILLNEFIIFLYENLDDIKIKERFNDQYKFLKLIICYYGISNGEKISLINCS